ncbi:MAG: sigma-70 family RNA polymerase sigma factor [Candidatus Rokuibacteriota bacterium]
MLAAQLAEDRAMRIDTELTLVERLRGGDAAALETLMSRYAPRVYRLAHGVTRHEADAEEVVQDVFLSIFRKIESFEGRAGLWTWIYRITTNAALIKRRGKRAGEVPLEDYLPTFAEDGHREGDRAMLLADWSEMPDEALLTRERRELVRRGIESLPESYQVVLLLRDMEELSNEETAEVLDESVASVKSRLHRARMALREHLTRSFASPSVATSLSA